MAKASGGDFGYQIPDPLNNGNTNLTIVMDYNNSLQNDSLSDNTTTPCSNEYCVSDDDYIDMIEKYIFPNWFEWLLIVLYFYSFLIGLVGNFLVCFAVMRNRHMRTVTNFFIVNLATADFMVILICLPPTVLEDVTETWYMGSIMCKIVKYLQGVSVSVSVLTLTAISIERFFAICYPLQFRSTTTRARVIIGVIWLVSIVLISPELHAMDTYPHPHIPVDLTQLLTSCKTSWPYENQMTYQLFQFVALYVFPFSLMGIAYTKIAVVLWSNHMPTESSNKPLNSSNGKTQMENQKIGRRKVAKMLIAVVLMFGVCYLPVHLLNVLRYARAAPEGQSSIYFALIAHWLCYFNSAINPVIYNFMSAKFRQEFNVACSCRRKKKHRYGDSMYSYKYTNDNTQTEHVTMTTLSPPIGSDEEKSWE